MSFLSLNLIKSSSSSFKRLNSSIYVSEISSILDSSPIVSRSMPGTSRFKTKISSLGLWDANSLMPCLAMVLPPVSLKVIKFLA